MAANGTAGQSRAPLGGLDSQPWVEKYRPKTLDDVAAHKDIIDTSEQAVHTLLLAVAVDGGCSDQDVACQHIARACPRPYVNHLAHR